MAEKPAFLLPFLALAFGWAVLVSGCSSQGKLERHLEKADRYFKAGRYEEAEIEYLNVVKWDPKNPRAVAQLGLIYGDQGRDVLAFQFLSAARDLDPSNADVRLRLGFFHLAANEREKAEQEALAILRQQPSNRGALILMAEATMIPEGLVEAQRKIREFQEKGANGSSVHLAAGTLQFRSHHYSNAEAEWRKALSEDAGCGEAYHALGNLFWLRNSVDDADKFLKKAAELSSPRSIRRLKYADFKIRLGEFDVATALLKKMTAETKDYLPAWNRQAELALIRTNFAECEANIRKVLSKDGANFDALLLEGRLRLEQKAPAKAVDAFQRMVQVFPKSADAHMQLGMAQWSNNSADKAITSWRQALELAPDHRAAATQLVRCFLARGDTVEAIRQASNFLERNPQSMEAHLLLGDACQLSGRLEEALRVFTSAWELTPRHPEPAFRRGMVELQRNEMDSALKAFNEALSIEKVFFPALDKLVDIYLAKKHFALASSRIAEAFESKRSAEFHFLSAKIAAAQEQFTEAEMELSKALELNNAFLPAHLLKAQLCFHSGSDQEAVDSLQAALQIDPRNVAALATLAKVRTKQGNFRELRGVYETWLNVEPQSVAALNNLAWIYSEHFGLLKEGAELATRALAIAPGHGEIKHTLGWIRCQAGDYHAGLALLEESARQAPENADIQYHLGIACQMLGKESRARKAFESALAQSNGSAAVSNAVEWLNILNLDPRSHRKQVRETLENWLEKYPNDLVATIKLGSWYEHSGDGRKAAEIYEKAVKSNTRDASALVSLSRVYQRQLGRTDRALTMARQAYNLAPGDPDVAGTIADIACKAGDYKWAVTLFETASRDASLRADQLTSLAFAYYAVGRTEDAEATLKGIPARDTPTAMRGEIETFLRFLQFERGAVTNLQELALAQSLLETNRNHLPALVVVATAAERLGEVELARKHYLEVLNEFPNFSPAKKRLAILYTRTPADWDKAYEWAEKARVDYPEDADMGKILTIRYYRRTLTSSTNTQVAADLEKLLNTLR